MTALWGALWGYLQEAPTQHNDLYFTGDNTEALEMKDSQLQSAGANEQHSREVIGL